MPKKRELHADIKELREDVARLRQILKGRNARIIRLHEYNDRLEAQIAVMAYQLEGRLTKQEK